VRYSKCPKCGFDLKYTGVLKELRSEHPRAFQVWTTEEQKKLVELVRARLDLLAISAALGRHPTSIRKRMEVLGLVLNPKLVDPSPVPESAFNESAFVKEAQKIIEEVASSGAAPTSPAASADER
jgi:hypothetical protein